jgi:integrase
MSKRGYGSGALYVRGGVWYGRWYDGAGDRPQRAIGRVREPGSRDGLTRTQAERALRRIMDSEQVIRRADRAAPTVAELGDMLVSRLENLGRKRSTIETVESHLRIHIAPWFGEVGVDEIDDGKVEAFIASLRRNGSSAKTARNVMGTLHSLFELARRRKIVAANPCQLVDLPRVDTGDGAIRFLDQSELEALLRASPTPGRPAVEHAWWRVEHVMYLAAAMTGMRQGELLALRWSDIDWPAQKARVHASFVRGEFGSPKSKRSVRAIPLAARLVVELDGLHRDSIWNADEDLVFANPNTGGPMDRSKVLKRFKAACKRAAIKPVRFHDLRHTFGTRIAGSGEVPMRTLQEWMGHRDFKTTQIYADYQPGEREAELIDGAFSSAPTWDQFWDQSEHNQDQLEGSETQ